MEKNNSSQSFNFEKNILSCQWRIPDRFVNGKTFIKTLASMDDRLHKVHLPFAYVVYPCTLYSTREEVNTKSFNGNSLKSYEFLVIILPN